jgi:hypothetical protein
MSPFGRWGGGLGASSYWPYGPIGTDGGGSFIPPCGINSAATVSPRRLAASARKPPPAFTRRVAAGVWRPGRGPPVRPSAATRLAATGGAAAIAGGDIAPLPCAAQYEAAGPPLCGGELLRNSARRLRRRLVSPSTEGGTCSRLYDLWSYGENCYPPSVEGASCKPPPSRPKGGSYPPFGLLAA